jgi:bifunctional ADP-heptose synthase (sugar kinase/adenylyltransferase)
VWGAPGAVVNDQDADDLKKILAGTGVLTALLVTERSRPTISKTRVSVAGSNSSELTVKFQGDYQERLRRPSLKRLVQQ